MISVEQKAYDAKRHREWRAKKALAAGRVPGRSGPKRIYSDEKRLELRRARSRSYWERNPEKHVQMNKKHYEENYEMYLAKTHRRRAVIRKSNGSHTAADIRQLWFLQHGNCVWCSQALGEAKPHVDHWIPLAKGGSNDKGNLRLLHSKCNLSKGTKDPREIEMFKTTLAA